MSDEHRTSGFDSGSVITEAERINAGHDNGYSYGEASEQAPAKMRGPRMPGANERWITLPAPYGDTDPPMKVRIWVNFPNRLADDLGSGDDDLIYDAWSQIVLEHNGWIAEDGRPLPPLHRGDADALRKFWGLISNECAQVIATVAFQAAGKASASLTNRAARRGR